MRLSDFLVVLNITALAHGSCGTSAAAGWDPKAAASNSRETRSARRVFNSLDQDGHPRRTVAFLGRRPSTATKRTPGESNPEVAVGELPNPAAADAGEVVGSTDTSADDYAQEPAEPRVSMAQGLATTVRDFWGNAKDGTVALWANFQISQDIRKRVKAGHAKTYAEHAHLERGATDRRKLLQYVIAYSISPKNFVYVIWYVPGLLPSTFEKPHRVRANYHRLALDRATATLEGLAGLENQLLKADAAFMGKPRRAGSRPVKKMERLEMQREKVVGILEASSKREVFEQFQEHMVVPVPPVPLPEKASKKRGKKQKQEKLKLPPAARGVPNAAIKALGKGTGLSGWWHVSPGFYVRYCLSERLKDLGRADDVLRTVSLESLDDRDLREACNARAIDVGNRLGGDSDSNELRRSLGEWLELTSPEVAAGKELGPDMVFLPDRARLLGLGLNCLESSRQGRAAELSRKVLLSSW
ncbi:unnamed protein product [Pylaiella littoralis]